MSPSNFKQSADLIWGLGLKHVTDNVAMNASVAPINVKLFSFQEFFRG